MVLRPVSDSLLGAEGQELGTLESGKVILGIHRHHYVAVYEDEAATT